MSPFPILHQLPIPLISLLTGLAALNMASFIRLSIPEPVEQKPSRNTSSSFVMEDEGVMPRGLHLAFVGDSVSRYQYLSLVDYLNRGTWVENEDFPNLVREKDFETWQAFFNYSSEVALKGHERCNCYRAQGKMNHQTYFENRYYSSDVASDNHVTYIKKMGGQAAQGHWDPSALPLQQQHLLSEAFLSHDANTSYTWSYRNWTDIVSEHLARLEPRPDFVVVNAGLWKRSNLDDGETLPALRQILDKLGMIGIYKTTTRRRFEKRTISDPRDIRGCQWMHKCLNLSWTGNLTGRENYWDDTHFQANVNKVFNLQLLALLRETVGQVS